MENEEPTKLVEWFNNMTIGDFASIMLLIAFTIIIIVLVARTFREKPGA